MSDLVKVYSPSGEPFEASPVNARDLVVHAGWTYSKPDSFKEAVENAVELETPKVETAEKVEEKADEVEEVEVVTEDEKDVESEAKEEVKSSGRGRPKK